MSFQLSKVCKPIVLIAGVSVQLWIGASGMALADTMKLTVEDAVRIAYQHSPKLRASQFEVKAGLAQIEREKPAAKPSVLTQAIGNLQGPRVTLPRGVGQDDLILSERYFRAEISIEQPIYHAGSGAARTRYLARTLANRWEWQRACSDLAWEVRRACCSLTLAQQMNKVTAEAVALAKAQRDQTLLMKVSGQASERDLLASEADLAEAESGQIKAGNGVTLARGNLSRLMGETIQDGVEIDSFRSEKTEELAHAVGIAWSRRPEIKILNENNQAARAGIALATSQSSPEVALRATAAAQTPTALTDSHYFSAGVAIMWHPFDRAKLRADVDEAKAQAGRTEALLDDARLGIKLEVESALIAISEARVLKASAVRQRQLAQKTLEISRLRFKQMAAIQVEVAASIFSLNKANTAMAQAQTDEYRAFADYLHAIGADIDSVSYSKVQLGAVSK